MRISRPVATGCFAIIVGAAVYFLGTWKGEERLDPASLPALKGDAASAVDAATIPARSSPGADQHKVEGKTPTATYSSLFDSAKNLNDLLSKLRVDVDNGDANATEIYARALEECSAISVNPAVLDDLSNPARKIPERMLTLFKERCLELAANRKITSAEINDLYRKAAQNGNPAAAAKILGEKVSTLPPDQVRQELQKIVQSGDPMALSELSNLMQRADLAPSAMGKYSGSPADGFAWQLAACDMGMDCGSNSYLVRQMCLFGGICGTGSLPDVIQEKLLSPSDFNKAMEVKYAIEKNIASGDYGKFFE